MGERQAELQVTGLSLSFGGIHAVRDVSLNVSTGELGSVIGPNGAGKTSLLNCITGFYKATSGKIVFNGRDITSPPTHRLTGLGIGGLAFALAAKDTVANVFGSITILVDRPFRVGDWITTDGADGVVEEIGLRSTRIRTFAKTVVSLPNQGLANATVENHSLMPKRRVKMTVGVTYSSSAAQMQTLVARIEALLRARDDVHQEFLLVKFTDFGASSLDVLIYYFTATTDWAAHLQARQEINLAVMGIVEEMGLSIAFPTRTVHLVTEGSADAGD